MAEIYELLDEGPLKIGFAPGASDTLVVSLSGVGRRQWAEPPVEFFQAAKGRWDNPVLFVRDMSRSWLNCDGMAERIVDVIETTAAQTGARKVVALGNSMGATMALHLSRLIRFSSVLAFTPQFSVDPAIVPEEKNWMEFRNRIKHFRFPQIEGLNTDATRYFVLHGSKPSELIHALRFPKARGLAHFILPGMGHKLTFELKDRGILNDLVGHAVTGRGIRFRKLLERQGGVFRSTFENRVAGRMANGLPGLSGAASPRLVA